MRGRLYWLLWTLLFLTAACSGAPPISGPTPTATTAVARDPVSLTILYTNDEHGWMEGVEPGMGAANMMARWRDVGYEETGPFLVLSGGDMWTGPAISTWFEGESMVEVMNGMGYAAAAVGNHEFDFGLDALRARSLESDFPFLSANTRNEDGEVPTEWGIVPYTVVDVAEIKVGIVGLTTKSTPVTTNPINVKAFTFVDYEEALREVVPQARADGADLIVVVGHMCADELVALAREIGDLNLAVMGGGHCNERVAREVEGTILIEGGYHFTSYATVELTVDPQSGDVLTSSYDVLLNQPLSSPDENVGSIVARWRGLVDEELDVVLGYSEQGLSRQSPLLHHLLVTSWLLAYPQADVALTNPGGFRTGLPPGPLTFADVVGVLPFNNVLVDVTLTGAELEQVLARQGIIAGARRQGGQWELTTGEPLEPDATYRLLTTDFLYAGGDGYEMLARFDPEAYNTAIDWRQPLIDWILTQESDATQPLDDVWEQLR